MLSFRPDRARFRPGTIGDFEVVFALPYGAKGEDADVRARVAVAEKPFEP